MISLAKQAKRDVVKRQNGISSVLCQNEESMQMFC